MIILCHFICFLNGPIPGLFLIYFRLFKPTLKILQQKCVKNVHPVYSAWIRTHNLQNTNLLPQPLGQSSDLISIFNGKACKTIRTFAHKVPLRFKICFIYTENIFKIYLWPIFKTPYQIFKKMGHSWPLFLYFSSFQYTVDSKQMFNIQIILCR